MRIWLYGRGAHYIYINYFDGFLANFLFAYFSSFSSTLFISPEALPKKAHLSPNFLSPFNVIFCINIVWLGFLYLDIFSYQVSGSVDLNKTFSHAIATNSLKDCIRRKSGSLFKEDCDEMMKMVWLRDQFPFSVFSETLPSPFRRHSKDLSLSTLK